MLVSWSGSWDGWGICLAVRMSLVVDGGRWDRLVVELLSRHAHRTILHLIFPCGIVAYGRITLGARDVAHAGWGMTSRW